MSSELVAFLVSALAILAGFATLVAFLAYLNTHSCSCSCSCVCPCSMADTPPKGPGSPPAGPYPVPVPYPLPIPSGPCNRPELFDKQDEEEFPHDLIYVHHYHHDGDAPPRSGCDDDGDDETPPTNPSKNKDKDTPHEFLD